MNAIALGLAVLVYSSGLNSTAETRRVTVAPAVLTIGVPDTAIPSRHVPPPLLEQFRPGRHASSQPTQPTTAEQPSKAARIVAIALCGFGGWIAGGTIGYAATSKPNDDTSGLRGVVIGAPIGAVVGAVIGYRITK